MTQRTRIALAALAVVCFALAARAAERSRQIVTAYKLPQAAITAPLPAETTLHIAIGLTPRDELGLLAFAAAVSDPKSPEFRRFLTLDQLTERFGPTAADYQALIDWAKSKNLTIEAQYPHRLTLVVSGHAADVEQAFAVKLGLAKRPDGSAFHSPDRAPSLDLPVKISHIAGLDNLFVPRHHGGSQGNGADYGSSDLRNAYAAGCQGLTGAGESVGIMAFSTVDTNAISDYETQDSIPAPLPAVNQVPEPSGYQPVSDDDGYAAENTNDVQMAIAMAPGLKQVVVYEGNPADGCAGGDAIFAAWLADPTVQIFSTSVGFCVSDDIDTEATMASQGQSIFSSSGDYGTGFWSTDDAKFNVFENSDITPVGGTVLTMQGAGKSYISEQGWYSSSGGVQYFSGIPSTCTPGCIPGSSPQCSNDCIPPYQVGVANAQNGASSTYRNDPDIAMPAANPFVYTPSWNSNGTFAGDLPGGFCGTSSSSPLMAGFLALADQQNCANSAANCAKGLGFVSPALYAVGLNPSTYQTSYHQNIVGSAPQSVCANPDPSATVVAGYNLATGWGSPTCGLVAQLSCTQCNGSTASAGTPGSNSCINFQTNSNHCGTCGNVCALNAGCVNGACKVGADHGDTHLITFDGVHYDFQAAGDYVLARAGKDFEVQTRQANGAPLWPLASVNKAVAARFGSTRVALCLAPEQLYVNGKAASLDDGKSLDAGPDVTVSRSGDTWTFARKDGETVQAVLNSQGIGLGFEPLLRPVDESRLRSFDENWIDVQVSLGRNPGGPVTGLLGNANGNLSDDIVPRNGLALAQPVPFTSLYKKFGDTWRVSAGESFLCDTPKVTPSDPALPFVAADLPAADTARARTYCQKAGVTNSILLEDCTLDTVVLDSSKPALIHATIAPPLLKLPILIDLPK
jgi:hypothetical protein